MEENLHCLIHCLDGFYTSAFFPSTVVNQNKPVGVMGMDTLSKSVFYCLPQVEETVVNDMNY